MYIHLKLLNNFVKKKAKEKFRITEKRQLNNLC